MNLGRFFLLGVPFALACVNGGDDSTTKPQGSLGGPCFANNTCNAGLDCVLQNGSGICQQGDATVADSPTNDVAADQSTSDAKNDAGDGATEAGCSVAPQLACPQYDCHGQGAQCCANLGTCGQNAQACNSQTPWVCVKQSDCGNFACCITATVSDPNACPAPGQTNVGSTCSGSTTCTGADYQLCETSAQCGGKACVAVSLSGIGAVVGFCM